MLPLPVYIPRTGRRQRTAGEPPPDGGATAHVSPAAPCGARGRPRKERHRAAGPARSRQQGPPARAGPAVHVRREIGEIRGDEGGVPDRQPLDRLPLLRLTTLSSARSGTS